MRQQNVERRGWGWPVLGWTLTPTHPPTPLPIPLHPTPTRCSTNPFPKLGAPLTLFLNIRPSSFILRPKGHSRGEQC